MDCTITLNADSVSEYLRLIKEHDLYDCISRGESSKYPSTDSSAFRLDDPRKHRDMIEKYYNIVGNTLTPLQEKHFLAFSQHHGIPTNIIDFSNSHLVSLFFACHGKEKKDTNGYVKFISCKRLINSNNLIAGYENGQSLLNDILDFSDRTLLLSKAASQFVKREPKYIVEHFFYLADLLSEHNTRVMPKLYNDFFKLVSKHKEGILSKELDGKLTLKHYSSYSEFLNALFNACQHTVSFGDDSDNYADYFSNRNHNLYSSDFNLYLFLLRIIFGETLMHHPYQEHERINLPFYLTYTPPNIDERIRSQSSIFIYQLFYEGFYNFETEQNEIFWKQNLMPDFEIEINTPDRILFELNKLGINLMSTYGDYDNVAKYVKETTE